MPSRVLYVKNLGKHATVDDVRSLFGAAFDSDAEAKVMSVRLMRGRMAGQAFVTLPSPAVAATALRCVHGYMLRDGEPVVVVRCVDYRVLPSPPPRALLPIADAVIRAFASQCHAPLFAIHYHSRSAKRRVPAIAAASREQGGS